MNILICGGVGYIGTTLVTRLLNETDHHITILDRRDYPVNHDFIYELATNKRVDLRRGDILHADVLYPLIRKNDAVINLAALVGEPLCHKLPDDAVLINEIGAQVLGDFCKRENKRLVTLSTCSNYGRASKPVNEDGDMVPVSIYAITKVNAEKYLLKNVPQATILRCATAYGLSTGRMRFDLLVNELVRDAFIKKKVQVYVPQANRPVCHVHDIAGAIMLILESRTKERRVYNVGSNDQNYNKGQIAKLVSEITGSELETIDREESRDYIVDFSRFQSEFKFVPKKTLGDGIREMFNALQNNVVSPHGGNVDVVE